MTLADTVRQAVETANKTTADLQVEVKWRQWLGTYDEFGKPQLRAAVKKKALLEKRQRLIRDLKKQEVMSQAYFAFLEPIELSEFDEIVGPPPEYVTGPILNFTGFVDAGTGHPYFAEVYLG